MPPRCHLIGRGQGIEPAYALILKLQGAGDGVWLKKWLVADSEGFLWFPLNPDEIGLLLTYMALVVSQLWQHPVWQRQTRQHHCTPFQWSSTSELHADSANNQGCGRVWETPLSEILDPPLVWVHYRGIHKSFFIYGKGYELWWVPVAIDATGIHSDNRFCCSTDFLA